MVGKTFSSLLASAFRSKGFSALEIWAIVSPFRMSLWCVFPVSSFASAMTMLSVSGFTPITVPLKVFPLVVTTETVLPSSNVTSLKYFLCVTDKVFFSFRLRDCVSSIYLY